MSAKITEAKIAHYELEVEIQAPRDRVWKAMTAETNLWWLPDFHMVGEGSVVSLRAEAGGALVERREGGGSLLWYTVHMVEPGTSLDLVGHSSPAWGGPATSFLRLALEDRGGGCALRVTDALVGRVTETQIQSLREGWTQLFTEGLKRHVEA